MCSKKLRRPFKKPACRMKKLDYGLKQAAENWFKEPASFFVEQSFELSENDYYLFGKNKNDRKVSA